MRRVMGIYNNFVCTCMGYQGPVYIGVHTYPPTARGTITELGQHYFFDNQLSLHYQLTGNGINENWEATRRIGADDKTG